MPKSCIDTRMANIVFSNDSNVSNIGVQVKEYKYDYDGESYFYIDYNNTFSGDENRVNSSHPFFNTKYIEQMETIKGNIWSDMHAMKASYPSIALSKEAALAAEKSFKLIRENYAK